MKTLLKHHADVKVKDNEGLSLVHMTTVQGHEWLLTDLMQVYPDGVDAQDHLGTQVGGCESEGVGCEILVMIIYTSIGIRVYKIN